MTNPLWHALSMLWLLSACVTISPHKQAALETDHLGEFLAKETADSSTLYIFDIDDVLLYPDLWLLQGQNRPILRELKPYFKSRYGSQRGQQVLSALVAKANYQPTEPGLPDVLSRLQDKGARVIALSHTLTGSYGTLAAVEDVKLRALKRLGYNFARSWPSKNEISFSDIPRTRTQGSPLYRNGILLTGGADKGEILKRFLERQGWMPSKVVFVDDKPSNIASVAKALDAFGLSYVGVKYTGKIRYAGNRLSKEEARNLFENEFQKLPR